MMAAIADFTAHYRPTMDRSGRRVLVLQSEQDRAFTAQADEIRAAYPNAVIHVLRGTGHGALFTTPTSTSVRSRHFWQRQVNVSPDREERPSRRPAWQPSTCPWR